MTAPFTGRQPPKGTRFVEPELVAVVEYRDITESGTLRAPTYKGLRDDLPATAVRFPEEEASEES